jgi:OOP family OmpA-OmpF porin
MKNQTFKKTFFTFGVAVIGLSNITPLLADDYSSGYLGLRAGYSYNDRSCESNAIKCDKDEAGYGIFTGYEFNRNWALELSYNDIGDTVATYPGFTLDGKLRQADLSIKASFPLTERIDGARMYGKLGAAYWDAEVSDGLVNVEDDGVRPLAGLGFEFPMSDHWTTRLEYQYIDRIGNRDIRWADAHFVGLALVWNFSSRAVSRPISTVVSNPQPVAPPPPPAEKRIVVDEHLNGPLFDFDKSVVRSTASIDPVIDELMQNSALMVTVIGHTDSRGAAEYNQRLSEERANSVAKYLQSKGVAPNRISVQGKGEGQPTADNQTEEGRAKNRRVEFVISGTKAI